MTRPHYPSVERVDEYTLRVHRRSPLTGVERSVDLPITASVWESYCRGAMVQHAFPGLTAGEREFVKTGITGEEWNWLFGEEE